MTMGFVRVKISLKRSLKSIVESGSRGVFLEFCGKLTFLLLIAEHCSVKKLLNIGFFFEINDKLILIE